MYYQTFLGRKKLGVVSIKMKIKDIKASQPGMIAQLPEGLA